jgi:hypothetical protein
MSGGHPGHYRGFIWACAEFEASLAQRRLHGRFTYVDFECCEAMLLSLRKRFEEIIPMKGSRGPSNAEPKASCAIVRFYSRDT